MRTDELTIRLLGAPEVAMNGEPVTGFISDKARALLYFLVATGEIHTRQALAALLWGDMPEAQALKNLRQALYNLQQLLAPYLDVTRQTARLKTDSGCAVDVAEMRAALADPEKDPAEIAERLYRGDFLAGFSVADAPDFELWQIREREHLRRQLADALHKAIGQSDSRRRLVYLRQLVRLEPWVEESQRHLMHILARQGEYSQALIQYERLVEALETELGVDPQPQTVLLRARIQRARVAIPSPLPPLPFALVGREGEENRLAEWLAAEASHAPRLITLLGPGGIGKTHLALATAHSQRHKFLDGVWWVALLPTGTANEAALAIAHTLSLPIEGTVSPLEQLLRHIANWDALLVLDNSEHLVDNDFADLILAILERAPEIRLLLTSRKRLNLRQEQLLYLDGLTDDRAIEALFVGRAQQVHPDFAPTATDSAAIQRMGRLLAGTPLALELAAALTDRYNCETIAHNIAASWDSLATTYRDTPPRQRSLRAVFDYSWDLMDETERNCLSLLTIFVDGFGKEAASVVASTLPADPAALLHSLVNHSLIRFQPQQARYSMHDLVRQYAQEKLEADPGLYRQAQEAHSLYFVEFLHSRDGKIQQGDPKTLVEVSAEMSNIQAMWLRVCDNRQVMLVAQALQPLGFFCDSVARYVEGKALYAYALRRLDSGANAGPPLVQKTIAGLLGAYGNMLDRLGEYTEAAATCLRAIEIAQVVHYHQAVGLGLLFLGRIEADRGDFAQGETYLRQAVDFCTAHELPETQARASFRLGEVLHHQGAMDQAREWYGTAQKLFQNVRDQRGLFYTDLALGQWEMEQGNRVAAQTIYGNALVAAQTSGQPHLIALVHAGLSGCLLYSDQPDKAEALLLAALPLLKDQPQSQEVLVLALRLAYLYTNQKQIDRALPLIHWAGWKVSRMGTPRQQLPVLLTFANFFRVSEQPQRLHSLVRLIEEEPASTWAQRRIAARLTGNVSNAWPQLWSIPAQALAELVDEEIAQQAENMVHQLIHRADLSHPAQRAELYQSIGLR